jgi:hypothetical protein
MALLVFAAPLSAERWRMQYFYDQDKAVLNIVDLQFPSAKRGVAVGVIHDERHEKPVAVVTADAGANWQVVNLEDPPLSLFFLNEGLGWMVTSHNGLWLTTEAGKNWRRLPKMPAQAFRVYFTDEKNGWAACVKKKVLQTTDGGQHWTPVGAAAEPPGNPDYSSYTWIAFANPQVGFVTGSNQPPRRFPQRLPDWMDPSEAMSRRETPHLSYSLSTVDGGKTWKTQSSSLFGEVTRVRLGQQGTGLGLIEHSPGFRYPSEAYKFDLRTGRSQSIYRDRQFAITDLWLNADGTAYLAGSVVTGQMRSVIPGKVRVLVTHDFSAWEEMEMDYRADATRVILAMPDAENRWLATDTGMILKLVK